MPIPQVWIWVRLGLGREDLELPGPVAVDGNALAAHFKGKTIGFENILDRGLIGHIDGLADRVGHHLAVVEGRLHHTLHQHVILRADIVGADQNRLYIIGNEV